MDRSEMQAWCGSTTEKEGYLLNSCLTRDNQVYFINGDFYTDIEVPTTAPSISSTGAVQVVLADLGGAEIEILETPSEELVILPYGKDYRLCWKVALATNNPRGKWIYYISAEDGSILRGSNEVCREDPEIRYIVQGEMYEHDPGEQEENPTVIRTIYVDHPGYELDNPFLYVENYPYGEAYETDRTFFYNPNNTHFDEVMVYYHAEQKFRSVFLFTLEYNWLGSPGDEIKITASVHYPLEYGWNVFAEFWPPDELHFTDSNMHIPGLNPSQYKNDPAKESDVVYHEYMHA